MTKQIKKLASTTAASSVRGVCGSHKVRAIIALVGLFACGLAIGWIWRGGTSHDAKVSDKGTVVMIAPGVLDQKPACQVIEDVLGQYVFSGEDSIETFAHNAKIYTLMAQQGCQENTEKFKAMARRELEVAIELSEYLIVNDYAVADVIYTYKKLNMQREAQEFLNKLQKLTDPAIDFIMKMENIINE